MTHALDLKSSNRQNFQRLLKITVATTRKILRCDRVLVYTASKLPETEILAKSIVSEYAIDTELLDITHFFKGEYLEMYGNGRAITIDNIYETDISKDHLEALKRQGIKSIAIAPIIQDKELLALAVAHQCSKPLAWRDETVNLLQERASTIGIVLANIFSNDNSNPTQQTATRQPEPQPQLHKSSMPTAREKQPSFAEIETELADKQSRADLLETTVTKVRQALNCDRVVVYCLNGDDYGKVIAESVTSGWTKALGRTIDDPCFEFVHLHKYRQGRVRAWDDIYCDDATPCYLEQLEELEVKANLVAPINGEGLFGLLIAHQCSNTRHWEEEDINWFAKIANKVGLMLEKKFVANGRGQVSPSPERETNWEQYYSEAVRHIDRATESQEMLTVGVEEVRRVLGCDRVIVYSLDDKDFGVVVAESVGAGWTKALGNTIDDPCLAVKYIEEYRQGHVRALNDIYSLNLTSCYLEQLEALEVKANLVAPILDNGELYGLLIAHQCSEPRNWRQAEIDWVEKITAQMGMKLDPPQMPILSQGEEKRHPKPLESKQEGSFANLVRHLHQAKDLKEALQTSVEEVRRELNCDRVVVYSLDRDFRYGTIVAESVAPGWTRAINKEIDDPCFEPTYRDKYRQGRVRTWENIYESNLTKCFIQQMEELEVKANLVTPINNEDKLFGLLVAHQCSDTRQWQQTETDWVAQIAVQVGFALDRLQLMAKTTQLQQQLDYQAQLNRYYTEATRYIRESTQPEDIFEVTVEEVRRMLQCDRVIVYSLDDKDYGVVVAESVGAGWTKALGNMIDDPCLAVRYIEEYRQGHVRALNDIYKINVTPCYLEQLEALEVKANLVAPLRKQGELYGLLIAHQCSEARDWQQAEIEWVKKIITQVDFALENAARRAETQRLQQQVARETKWMEYFTDTVRTIRQSSRSEDILKTSVKEVRRVLDCDRVVVYSLDHEFHNGTVIAESVAPGWTRTLNSEIDDPSFEPIYRQQYLNGRVRAWTNIYESGISRRYIEQLERLEVKANLVAPIINEGELFGLLVAHQCSEFREWQQTEIRWVAQVAMQVGFALDNAKLLSKLETTKASELASDRHQERVTQFQEHLAATLSEQKDVRQAISQEATLQSATAIDVLHKIQRVANIASNMSFNIQQVKFQEQQNELTVRGTQETLNRAIESVTNVRQTVKNVAVELNKGGRSFQQLAEAVTSIEALSKQIVQQMMNLTRVVSRLSVDEDSRNSLTDLADAIFTLVQQLFEASALVKPSLATTKLEVGEKAMALDLGTQQLVNAVGELQVIRQQLEQITALKEKINDSIDKISQGTETQAQDSLAAKDSLQEVADIAERLAERVTIIDRAFSKLSIAIE